MARSLATGSYTETEIAARLRSPSAPYGRRFEILDTSGSVLGELTGVSAAKVTVDTDRKINSALTMTMEPDLRLVGDVMFKRRIRPWFRLGMPDGGIAEWPMGVYLWTVPNRSNEGVEDWTITIPDLLYLLESNGPDLPGYWSALGSTVYSHILAILGGVGISDFSGVEASTSALASEGFWGTIRVTAVDEVTGLPTIVQGPAPQTWLSILTTMFRGAGAYAPWFDLSGRFRFTNAPDLRNSPATFSYAAGPEALIEGFDTSSDISLLANRIVGRANNTGGFFGLTIIDANTILPDHPIAQRNLGWYMSATLDFPTAGNQADLDRAATLALLERISRSETAGVRSFANPAHETFEIVELYWPGDSDLWLPKRYRERGWTLDLFSGEMEHTLYRTVEDRPITAPPLVVQAGEGEGDPTGTPGVGIDLVIENVRFDPPSPEENDHVDIYATIRNDGDTATPAGTILDFFVSAGNAPNAKGLWSDTHTASLAPGDTVELQVNSGWDGIGYWLAERGNQSMIFQVNSINRITPEFTGNNTFTTSLVVIPEGTGPTEPVTTCDDFERADGSPGAGWSAREGSTSIDAGTLISDDLAQSTLTDVAFAHDLDNVNHIATATISEFTQVAGGVVSVGPVVRVANSGSTYYALVFRITDAEPAGSWYIQSVVATVEDELTTPTAIPGGLPSVPFEIELEVVDDELTARLNGTDLGSVTDSSIVAGTHAGLAFYRLVSGDLARVEEFCATSQPAGQGSGGGGGTGGGGSGGGGTGGGGTPGGGGWDGTTQPVMMWVGTIDVDHLSGGGFGGNDTPLRFSSSIGSPALDEFQIAGVVWSVGQMDDPLLGGNIAYAPIVRANTSVCAIGCNTNPLPGVTGAIYTLSQKISMFGQFCDQAALYGFDWMMLDLETYSQSNTAWWDFNPDDARAMGVGFGNHIMRVGIGKLLIYPSSDASFPGSYNDLINNQPGNSGPNVYIGNRVIEFVDGLLSTGVDVCWQDASFQFGVQWPGDGGDWQVGIAHSVALTEQAYPAMRGSSMLWPENTERNGASESPWNPWPGLFDPAQFESMMYGALKSSHGPIALYQHHACTDGDTSLFGYWDDSPGYLQSTDAAITEAGP